MSFKNALIMESVRGTPFRIIYKPFVYVTKRGSTITVPEGYNTDLASVPRGLWNFSPPGGKYREAAVIHDYIYTDLTIRFTKKEADRIFLEAMEEIGINWFQRKLMYAAVRIGGRGNWNKEPDDDFDDFDGWGV